MLPWEQSMSVRINNSSAVIRNKAVEARGGLEALLRDVRATTVSADRDITAIAFSSPSERNAWVTRLRTLGVAPSDLADVEAESEIEWLVIDRDMTEAWLRGTSRDTASITTAIEHTPFEPLEHLSQSDSGIHFVRERKSGLLRQLTEEELKGFDDPPPCTKCGEQFGCDHYNCAREPMLDEAEVEREVPPEWRSFARDYGVSRSDLDRLRSIQRIEGEYRLSAPSPTDMRMQELVLLLNESL
jgi:hypothetical protein